MPFCTTCGSQISGRFCEKCGAAAGSSASPAAAPRMQPEAVAPAAPAAVQRKSHVLLWILGGFAVLMLLFVGAVTIGGVFLFHKAKQAGLDPDLWQRNPGLAATKMLAAANPDAEIVSMDERGGGVVVRDKKTGKTIRMNFADIKNGHMTLEGDGEKVSIAATGNGDTGAFEVQSKDGTARFTAGAGMQLPSWLPAYPGAKDAGGISTSGRDGASGTYGFKTTDSPAAVAGYYESALKKQGFTIQEKVTTGETTVLAAEGGSNTANVGATAEGGQTSVTISFAPKSR